METWITHAQRFLGTGLRDQDALKQAVASCDDKAIAAFLSALPWSIEQGRELADAHLNAGKPHSGLTIQCLANALSLIRIESPLQIPQEKRSALFGFIQGLVDSLRPFPELIPSLAMLCHTLGTGLLELKDYPASRTAYEEALPLYRRLAAAEPAAYLRDVAMTLNNLANLLNKVRDYPASRANYEEALPLYRQLAAAEPTAYLPHVAATLNNLGNLLREIRDYSASRAAYEEALPIYRHLAEAEPAVYSPHVATTLNNLATLLFEVRDYSVAHAAFEEALTIRRRLAEAEPAVYLPDVADTLNNLGLVLNNTRDYSASRAAFEEALTTRRRLAAAEPAVYLPAVAMTLNNLAVLLNDIRDYSAARGACEEAVEVAERATVQGDYRHLSKTNVERAYRSLLKSAIDEQDGLRAFALVAAMRDGQAVSGTIHREALQGLQDWLGKQEPATGRACQILLPTSGPDGELSIGLITSEAVHFSVVATEGWEELFPPQEPTPEAQRRRHRLAGSVWQGLPEGLRQALIPEPARPVWTLVSGDPFWSAFPWELLRFGDGEDDYLGLHQVLPRIGAIQATDLRAQCRPETLGKGTGSLTVLAPHDTGWMPLAGVIPEIHAVKQAIEARGGQVLAFASGTEASDVEARRQWEQRPDILYYSGHGAIVQNEELLVVHRDLQDPNALTPTAYVGKQQLMAWSDRLDHPLFDQRPLIVLNSCVTGRSRQAGGAREDLVHTLLDLGAGAIIASALPVYDAVGQALGESLFDPRINDAEDLGTAVLNARRHLASGLCADRSGPFWGAWSMIHIHGNARARLPFKRLYKNQERFA